MTKITRFNFSYLRSCLELFQSNRGKYFDESEFQQFQDFLKNKRLTCDFFVIEDKVEVYGCGGFMVLGDSTVELVWGMVNRARHGEGFGTKLIEYRQKCSPSRLPGQTDKLQ